MPRYIPGAACWWPMAPKPPVHRRSSARCTSRRWRLLACPYWAEKGRPAFLGECTAAGGSTTARFRVVSKCALSRGPAKRTERPGHPRTLPPSVPSCWSITAFPACVIPLYFCYQIAISVDSSSTKLEITMVVSKTHQGQFYNKRNISFVYSSHKCSFKSSSAVIKYSIIRPRRFTLSILLNYTSK